MIHDLHAHSTYSDGTLTPSDLVARAAQRGVHVLALTDHDDTSGLAQARIAAQQHGLRLIDGVEISVTWRECTVHIVGLAIDPEHGDLRQGLEAIRNSRLHRARKIALAFDAIGISGTLEGASRLAANPQLISRTHFARHLVQTGVVKDMHAAFKRFLGGGQPCFVPLQWAALEQAVAWINGSGGLAVIAHPGRYPLDSRNMSELIGEFRDMNGAAIEVVCGGHKLSHYQVYARYAKRFGLCASSGSDFHSPTESHRDLGSLPALPLDCRPVWEKLH